MTSQTMEVAHAWNCLMLDNENFQDHLQKKEKEQTTSPQSVKRVNPTHEYIPAMAFFFI